MKSFDGLASEIRVNILHNSKVKHVRHEIFDVSPFIISLQLAEDNSCFANARQISVFSICSIELVVNHELFHFRDKAVIRDSFFSHGNRHVAIAFQISNKELLVLIEKSKNDFVCVPRVNNDIAKPLEEQRLFQNLQRQLVLGHKTRAWRKTFFSLIDLTAKRNELVSLRVTACHNAVAITFSLVQMVIMEGCAFHLFSSFMRAAVINDENRIFRIRLHNVKRLVSC